MKKFMVIFLSFLSMGTLIAQDLKLDELLQKYSKSRGENIQTVKMIGKMIQQGSPEFQITSFEKRPDMFRQEMEVQGTKIIVAYKGQIGWIINPGLGSFEPQDMPSTLYNNFIKELRTDPYASWYNPIVNWKEKGNKIELVGKEDIDGKPVYNLKLTFPDNEVANYYMDATKFLILVVKEKTMEQGQMNETEDKFSDFRDVDGVQMPFKIETITNGQPSTTVILDKCEFNLTIDDAIFKKPVAEKK
jgi:outer membrane lipoprotein-sorting protein